MRDKPNRPPNREKHTCKLEHEELDHLLLAMTDSLDVLDAKLDALVELLIARSLFTADEFVNAVGDAVEREQERREAKLKQMAWEDELKSRSKQ